MFIKAIKEAFIKWWDKIGYAVMDSLIGAINPFFLGVTLFVFWLLMPSWNQITEWNDLLPYIRNYILLIVPAVLAAPFWPLTFSVFLIQKRVVEYETSYFKRYFPDYIRGLWKSLPVSLLFMLIFAAIGFILAYAGVFYAEMVSSIYVKIIIFLIIAWIVLFLKMVQFVMIPLLCYNYARFQFRSKTPRQDSRVTDNWSLRDETEVQETPVGIRLGEAVQLSIKLVLGEGLLILGIMILNGAILLVLTLSRALSVFFYYGISSNLRIYLHKQLVEKYTPKSENETDYEQDYYSRTADAWARMLKKIQEREEQKKSEDQKKSDDQ